LIAYELHQQAPTHPCFNSVNVASNGIDETPRLPSEIFLLSNLRELDLSSNSYSGSVPTEIGLLSDLVELQLGDNKFTGAIPSELGQSLMLQILNLVQNALTGPIPSELGLISTLRILNLEQNALTGPIPSELGQIPSLQDFYLYDNALTGPIPSELPTRLTLPYKLVKEYKVSIQALQDPSSPQYEALAWMAYIDSSALQSTLSDDELVERFALVLLYYAAGGESWSDQVDFLNPLLNTCSWNSIVDSIQYRQQVVDGTRVLGVGCNNEGSVVTLDLGKFPKSST
jgi:hypothetical protein